MSLCKWYEKGRCRNGKECRFAHGAAELRGAATNANAATATAAHAARGTAALATSSEPEPMKVLSAESMEPAPPGQALAAPAAGFMGNRLPKTPWSDPLVSSPYAVHDDSSWQLRCKMQDPFTAPPPRSVKQSSLNSFVEMEQLRLSIASLSARCAQMQKQLQHRQLIPPGLEGSSFGGFPTDIMTAEQLAKFHDFEGSGFGSSVCFPPDITTAEQLAKFQQFEVFEKMIARNALHAAGLSKEALGA